MAQWTHRQADGQADGQMSECKAEQRPPQAEARGSDGWMDGWIDRGNWDSTHGLQDSRDEMDTCTDRWTDK